MCGNEEQSTKEGVKNLFRTANASMAIEDSPDQPPTTEEPDQGMDSRGNSSQKGPF